MKHSLQISHISPEILRYTVINYIFNTKFYPQILLVPHNNYCYPEISIEKQMWLQIIQLMLCRGVIISQLIFRFLDLKCNNGPEVNSSFFQSFIWGDMSQVSCFIIHCDDNTDSATRTQHTESLIAHDITDKAAYLCDTTKLHLLFLLLSFVSYCNISHVIIQRLHYSTWWCNSPSNHL